jgi:hypothetical protein
MHVHCTLQLIGLQHLAQLTDLRLGSNHITCLAGLKGKSVFASLCVCLLARSRLTVIDSSLVITRHAQGLKLLCSVLTAVFKRPLPLICACTLTALQ